MFVKHQLMHYIRCLDDKKCFDFFFLVLWMVVIFIYFGDHNLTRIVEVCLVGSQKIPKLKITNSKATKSFWEEK